MTFQAQVNQQPAVGVAGDFADAGMRTTLLFGGAGLVSAPSPRQPTVGNFVWGDQLRGLVYGRNFGGTDRVGFLHRNQQAIIQDFLADQALVLQPGLILTVMTNGTFWARFPGTAAVAVGLKVFANYIDGTAYAAAAGTSTQKASVTASLASTGVLTVSAVASGTLAVGQVLVGGNIPAGSGVSILSQLSGTAGGTGTYQTTGNFVATSAAAVLAFDSIETNFRVLSPVDAVASFTGAISAAGVLTASSVTGGSITNGLEIVGTGVPRATRILGQITGTSGSDGTYRTNLQVGPVVSSTAMTTKTGRLAKISSWS